MIQTLQLKSHHYILHIVPIPILIVGSTPFPEFVQVTDMQKTIFSCIIILTNLIATIILKPLQNGVLTKGQVIITFLHHFGLIYFFVEGVQLRIAALTSNIIITNAISLLNRRNRRSIMSDKAFSKLCNREVASRAIFLFYFIAVVVLYQQLV